MFKRLISSKQQLLTGLPAGIKGSGNLNPSKRTVCERTAILARKGDSLRHTLVDYIQTDLGQAINIRFSRPKITSFDGVIEQPENTIAVVLIILGSVDTTLRGDTVGPARRILEAKALNVIS